MRLVGLVLVLFILTSSMVYAIVGLKYQGEIERSDQRIESMASELIQLWTEQGSEGGKPAVAPAPELPSQPPASFCLSCHEKAQVTSFHTPERIKEIDESRGRPVRICTTCHGSPVMPVHYKAIQRGSLKCDACHLIGGGPFTVPEKREGDLLVCQLCHAKGNYITIHIDGEILEGAPIDSKWIKRRPGLACTACHNQEMYGGLSILELHAQRASKAGRVG